MTKMIQPSTAGGEVSASVGARVDLAKRQVAVERAENFIATFTGSMRSRPGQKFVAQCKGTAGDHRIIEFEFNSSQTFVLELGAQYIRFHTAGQQILDSANVKTITGATQADPVVITSNGHGLSNGAEVFVTGVGGMTELNGRNLLVANVTANTFELTRLNGDNVDGTGYGAYTSGGTATPPYELTTPWAAADLFDISYAQSGDVMTLVHPDYTPRELVRIDNDTWTLTELMFMPTQARPTQVEAFANTALDIKPITGITQANPGVFTISAHGYSVGDRVLIESVGGMVEVNNFNYEVRSVLNSNTVTLALIGEGAAIDTTGFTAYTSGGQSVLSVRPRKYVVTAVNLDDEEESLVGTSARDITVTNITQANPCVVTTAEGHGLDPFDNIVISGVVGMTELNGEQFQTVFIDTTSFSLQRLDNTAVSSTTFGAYVSGGVINPDFAVAGASADALWDNTIFWEAAPGAASYNVYATDNFGVFGFIGQTDKNRFEDINLGPDYSTTPPRLYNPFDTFVDGADKQPAAVGFFQQRRVFANSNSNPNRFWMSQTGHFGNLSRSSPPLDTDSIVASIAARRINEIRHVVPLSDLIFFTSGGEYRGFSDTGVITPSTLNVRPQSYYGATKVRPIVAGEVGLFVTPGQFVRSFSYEFARDKFVGEDLTLLARHLFDFNSIVDWDFASAPYSTAFVVRDDGEGLFLTYRPANEVYAWARATTQGAYKSTCVVREGENDIHYMLVERRIAGDTVKFIERMSEHKFTELSDAFCVDAGLTYDTPITVTGATAANPVVITAPAHGLSNGDTVDISDVMEVDTALNRQEKLSTDYNGTGYTVANVTTDTFELQIAGIGYDGSGFAAFSSGGKARKAVTTVGGLWHLEGATVVAAANGYTEKGLVVSGGAITLNAAASRIHVGLQYTSKMVSLPLDMYNSRSPSNGKLKNITQLTVEVERSMGMWTGPSENQMREATFGLPARYGQPLAMVTDSVNVTLKGDWARRKQVIIEQRDPLPLTILSFIPDAIVGGN